MTSSHHAPYVQGYTRATLAYTKGCDTARWSESHKVRLGSDCRLKLAYMKVELLVIVDQHATVNLYLSLVLTARHALEVEWIGSILLFMTKSVFFSLITKL